MKDFAGFEKIYITRHIKRHIKYKEQELDRKCRKVWACTNRLGESILYGSFCKNWNRLIVSLGYWNKNIHAFLCFN